ncbi:MAG: response regulator [Chloroflexi bacterium]|nr:response regulator [Chloroflexota bacterium]
MNEKAIIRILVIDDEESIRYAVDAGLEFIGDFEVHFAEDGASGIAAIKELSPDVVLLDLVLHSTSGMDVLEAIRTDPDIKRPKRVVLMTGVSDPVPIQHLEDLGIDRVLAKPFKLEQLKKALFE